MVAKPYYYWSSVSESRGADSSDHTNLTTLRDFSVTALYPSDTLMRTRVCVSLKAAVSGNQIFLQNWWQQVEVVMGIWYDPTGNAGVLTDAPSPFAWTGGYRQGFVVHERLLSRVESYDATNFSQVVRWETARQTENSEARRTGDGVNVASVAVAYDGVDRSGKLNTVDTHHAYWLGCDVTLSCLFATDVPPPP